MGKIVYVNGYIIVNTQYFVPKDIGVGYSKPPEGTDIIIEPVDEFEGIKCLLVDDEHPQSLFNEYFAKEDASTDTLATSYLSASYLDSLYEYKKRVGETCDVIKSVSRESMPGKLLIYKMAFVNIFTALDAFLCYILVKRGLQDEQLFHSLMFEMAPNSKKNRWRKLIEAGKVGEWEQDAIRFAQETSYLNADKIDSYFKCVGFCRLDYDRLIIKELFRKRHLLVHRSGKQRDDTEIDITYELLSDLVIAVNSLVWAIINSVYKTLSKEMESRPPERDIEEIFPGGVVRTPFRLSDLSRFLMRGAKPIDSTSLVLPVL